MKLLHVDASILGASSVSRQLSEAIVAQLKSSDPALEVVYRDITAAPLPHLDGAHLAAAQGVAPKSADVQADLAESKVALDQFLAADVVVIGAPMYNFTIPSQLKAWIDRILVAGKTFKYSDKGAEGLAKGKRVIIAVSRGGLYGAGAPAEAGEHLETYLRWVFGFIGIVPEIIIAEGLQLGPEHRQKAVDEALAKASALQAA